MNQKPKSGPYIETGTRRKKVGDDLNPMDSLHRRRSNLED
jgi:hypothetical protein